MILSIRRRRMLVAVVAAVAGLINVVIAAIPNPVIALDDVQIHLGESGDIVSRYVLLIAAVILLTSVRGLRRGNRLAWDAAAVATALGFIATQARDADGPGVIAGIAMVATLAVSWSACAGRSERPSFRRGIGFLFVGLLGAYLYGVAGLYLLDADFLQATTLVGSITDAARVLVWVAPANIGPPTPTVHYFVDSVRFLVLLVCAATALLVVRASRVTQASSDDRADARRVLDDDGRNGLAYFNLLDDKLYSFTPDRCGFLGYKVVGNVAIALGDPVGPFDRAGNVVDAFLTMCTDAGLEPCLHQASSEYADIYAAGGLTMVKIGEEAIIDLAEFSLDQPGMKTVRKKSNKLARDGVVVEALSAPIDGATMSELRDVSDAWLDTGGHRERSFTLGRFDPAYLRDTTVLVARSPGDGDGPGRIEAFVNLVPVYHGANGNFDLMRKRPDAPASVMDLLFVSMIERFRGRGLRGMNLGLAPLAGITGTTPADRVAHQLYARADRFFNYQGLYEFKNKWRPRWEPRFLVVRSSAAMAGVLPALAVVGEHDGPVTRRPFVPSAHAATSVPRRAVEAIARLPRRSDTWLFGVLVAVVMATQVATIGKPVRFDRWRAAFAVSWDDVKHLRLLRIMTSSLIQTEPGLVWSIVAFAVLALACVTWRIGGRRAVLVWFVADPIATAILFVATQLVAWLGVASVDRYLIDDDSGSSSGMLAVITAAILTFHGRGRHAMFGVLVVSQIAFLAATQKSAYVHHLIAIGVTVAFVTLLDRRRTSPRRETVGAVESSRPTELV